MNKPIFAIVGPTGTGKTARAIELSKQQPSILISADSRQVYRGMDIVTGKDHPHDVSIYGIDLVDPDESCSVSLWYDSVMPHVKSAWEQGKLPIVVGGTGLYVKALTHGIPTMSVPINQSLREELSSLSIAQLQDQLESQNPAKFASMNHSDANNSRRLIRAIEIEVFSKANRNHESVSARKTALIRPQLIGLKYSDLSIQRNKIHQRVLERLDLGAISETQLLLNKFDSNLQSMSAIGYKSIKSFLNGKLSRDEMIAEWVSDEMAYVKRQLTWFKKLDVTWLDVDQK